MYPTRLRLGNRRSTEVRQLQKVKFGCPPRRNCWVRRGHAVQCSARIVTRPGEDTRKATAPLFNPTNPGEIRVDTTLHGKGRFAVTVPIALCTRAKPSVTYAGCAIDPVARGIAICIANSISIRLSGRCHEKQQRSGSEDRNGFPETQESFRHAIQPPHVPDRWQGSDPCH